MANFLIDGNSQKIISTLDIFQRELVTVLNIKYLCVTQVNSWTTTVSKLNMKLFVIFEGEQLILRDILIEVDCDGAGTKYREGV